MDTSSDISPFITIDGTVTFLLTPQLRLSVSGLSFNNFGSGMALSNSGHKSPNGFGEGERLYRSTSALCLI
jgi:hypothetical protein